MTHNHRPLPSQLFPSIPFHGLDPGLGDIPALLHTTRDEPQFVQEFAPEVGVRQYTVILVSGGEDGGKRATLAFSMACTALSLDLDTHLFLVGDGSIWAYEGHAQQARMQGFPPLYELMNGFQELGGGISVCSTCDRAMCAFTGDGAQPAQRLPGIQVQGMATLLARVKDGRAVTF